MSGSRTWKKGSPNRRESENVMTPQAAAGLIVFVGLCLLAGWVTGFRNRSYVGWLGLAFIALAGFLAAIGQVKAAKSVGGSNPGMATIAWVLLVVWVGALILSAVSALRETARRLREVRASHEEAAEGLLELMRASQEQQSKTVNAARTPELGGAEDPKPPSPGNEA